MTDLWSLTIFGSASIRLVKNLSVTLSGSYQLVEDQFELPLSSASDEEILLGTIRLPTSWRYSLGGSLTYRFGSRFNNVVNPRM